jgi:GntR family transcriptional regulator
MSMSSPRLAPGLDGARSRGSTLKSDAVAAALRTQIHDGTLPSGTLMPAEHQIAHQFDVSRGTVRSALAKLAREEIIATRNGVGSFVTFDGSDLDGTLGWTDELSAAGVDSTVEVVGIVAVTDPELAAEVGSRTMSFVAVDRVRRLRDGTAISLERSRVPAIGSLARLPHDGLDDLSLTAALRAENLVPHRGEQWLSVVRLSSEDARLLGVPDEQPFLHSVRISRDAGGEFVEKVVSLLSPDRFRLHMRFRTS